MLPTPRVNTLNKAPIKTRKVLSSILIIRGIVSSVSGGRNRNQAATYGWTAGSEYGGTFNTDYVGNFRSP